MAEALIDAIIKNAMSKTFPDDTAYLSLSVDKTLRISKKYGVSGRDAEIAALAHGVVPERYARNRKSFAAEDQGLQLIS